MDLSPKFKSEKFQCPSCGIASQHTWFDNDSAAAAANKIINNTYLDYRTNIRDYQQEAIAKFIQFVSSANIRSMSSLIPKGFSVATCSACHEPSLWINRELVYPRKPALPAPNSDLNDEIKSLYVEASSIFVDSPKGATALLRLSLQLLLKDLGKTGKNINNDIKELVEAGLSPKIQQALDLLRVVGNNAVHPGQIDLNDDKEVAMKMFHVLNFVADELITKPKELDLLYAAVVPEETKGHIKQRDASSKA
ncbi:MAG: hypothetical protein RLZZ271_1171 [Pseudomonadota bacterium]|jgi:hypothetical protein